MTHPRLNLDYLRAFVEVIERGTFSAAAVRLGLTQPAVSVQVRQLEKQLGARLIERVGRTARPTAAGADLLTHAARIDAAVSAARDAMARHASGALGRVRVGTGATACAYLLPALLRDVRRRLPTLEITVTTGNTVAIVKAIEENLIDVGLVTMPVAGRTLEVTPVVTDEFVVVAPPRMELPARVTPAVLASRPMVLFEPGGHTRRIADEWFARTGVTITPMMSLGSVEAIKEMAAAGLTCAVLPGLAVRRPADRAGLVVRSLTPRLYRRLAVVVRKDKPLRHGLGEMVRALKGLGGAAPPRGR